MRNWTRITSAGGVWGREGLAGPRHQRRRRRHRLAGADRYSSRRCRGFLRGVWTMFASRDGHLERDVWLRLGRWLVAGLTFQLAADILETAITTSWDEVARLGGDRRDPHVPQLFPRARHWRGPAEARIARRRAVANRAAPMGALTYLRRIANPTDWCPGKDSNLHGLHRWYLKPVRLPIPPPGHRPLLKRAGGPMSTARHIRSRRP